MIQFASPVKLNEIRVVPLGTKIEADFPMVGYRLGATIPSKISLQFYANDATNTSQSVFSEVGWYAILLFMQHC